MSTVINVVYNKKEYNLEYSRFAVKQMEKQGFVIDKVGDMPANMIPILVQGAFIKNHRDLKAKQIDEIYKNIINKVGKEDEDGFLNVLLEMYAETVNSLTDNDDVDEGNAATWTVSRG